VVASRTYTVPPQVAEVPRLMVEHPTGDAVVEEIDGRRIQVDGHWLVDFASCNYLGLDLEVIAQVPAYLARWGTHPSWARAIASPEPYRRVEAAVSELLGSRTCSPSPPSPTLTTACSRPWPARGRSWSTCGPTEASTTPPWSPRLEGPPCGASAQATSTRPAAAPRAGQGAKGALPGRHQTR
jgi:hypothetical protein